MKTKPIPPDEGYLLPRIARAIRENAGITSTEMAKRLGVTPPAVSQYEDASTPITEPTLRAYAAALDVPFDRVLLEAMMGLRLAAAGLGREVVAPSEVSSR